MANTWFRLYDEVVDDPKVQRLTPALFKAWINLMCIASKNTKNRGTLPNQFEVSYRLHIKQNHLERVIEQLVEAELFERRGDMVVAHNWANRQFQSDCSGETEQIKHADRMRRHRTRDLPRDGTVPSRGAKEEKKESIKERKEEVCTDTDTETDTERVPSRACANARVSVSENKIRASLSEHQTEPVPPAAEGFRRSAAKMRLGEYRHVLLLPEELADLQARLTEHIGELIAELDLYGETHPGKFAKYKNHKAVLLTWAARRQKENGNGQGRQNYETKGEYTARKNKEAGKEARRQLLRDAAGDSIWPDDPTGADRPVRKGFGRSN